jgi:hypothetical protein
LDLAGNYIQKGGFTCPVRTDNHPQFSFFHGEIEVIDAGMQAGIERLFGPDVETGVKVKFTNTLRERG